MSSLFEESAPAAELEARIRHLVTSCGRLVRCQACGNTQYLLAHGDGSYHAYDLQGRVHERICPARAAAKPRG